MNRDKTFQVISKLQDIEVELHRLKNALELANKALDAELAKPDQEPVAWGYRDKNGDIVDCLRKKTIDHDRSKAIDYDIPLYTAPTKREWQGLSVNEARDFYESKLDREQLICEISEFLEKKNDTN